MRKNMELRNGIGIKKSRKREKKKKVGEKIKK
jgi:hypothetical protein